MSSIEFLRSTAMEIARDYFHDTTARLFGIAPLQAAGAP
jgi:hypothetical protein